MAEAEEPGRVRDTVAGLTVFFAERLPLRLEELRSAWDEVTAEREGGLRRFHRLVHSLAGTAPAFGAEEMAAPGRELSELARRWEEQGRAPAEEWPRGLRLLDALERAGEAFRVRHLGG